MPLGLKNTSLFLAICISALSGCTSAFESFHRGKVLDEASQSSESQYLTEAKAILEAKCASCHNASGGSSSFRLDYQTDAEFIAQGVFVPGSLSQSRLILRLKNYDGASPVKDMPRGDSLTDAEYQILVQWVNDPRSAVEDIANPFICENSDHRIPENAKRLSKRQYLNTLTDLIRQFLPGNAGNTIINNFVNINSLPNDVGTNFRRQDTDVTSTRLRGYFTIADSISAAMTSSQNIGTLLSSVTQWNPGSCGSPNVSNLSQACRQKFIENLGLFSHRRPLSPAQIADYQQEFQAAPDTRTALENIVFRFLMAPHFLFHIENNETQTSGNNYNLSSWSIASRLSYMFWNSMPDAELLRLAASNDFQQQVAFEQALTYVFSRKDKMADFLNEFTGEWLHFDRFKDFNNTGTQKYQMLTNGMDMDVLRSEMENEVTELVRYTAGSNGSFTDLFTSNISFARTPSLMSVYDQSIAAPTNTTEVNAVRFPAGERAGLLTRAALLTHGSENANLVQRGIFIRRELLCLELSQPPSDLQDEIDNVADERNPLLTTRQNLENATSAKACVSCHSLINPFGFALSNYNAFGKYETSEPLFNNEGTFLNQHATVDPHVDLSLVVPGQGSQNNPVEYSESIANSRDTRACFTKKFYQYATRRTPASEVNPCQQARIFDSTSKDKSLMDIFRSFANHLQFRTRRIEQ